MAKKDDGRHLITLEFEADRATVSLPEREASLHEWSRRKEAYCQLRTAKFVPDLLIDLVENFEELTRVNLMIRRLGEKPEFAFSVTLAEPSPPPQEAKTKRGADPDQMSEPNDEEGITASDALAFLLINDLRTLKQAQAEAKAAPVRRLKLLPRSLIAEIAQDLLLGCAMGRYPPGSKLCSLIKELLDLDRERAAQRRDFGAQQRAVHTVAMAPNVGTRELANALDVNPSTISRWRKSEAFKEMVRERRGRNQLNPDCEFKGSPVSREDISFILKREESMKVQRGLG